MKLGETYKISVRNSKKHDHREVSFSLVHANHTHQVVFAGQDKAGFISFSLYL